MVTGPKILLVARTLSACVSEYLVEAVLGAREAVLETSLVVD
jgi:hypothetical protein